ncbi:MAG: prepilin-type N-terminal cleavage/methylation domain-containing protein, partial [Actinomycetota bacterium]|nr:prepilin-type N-terminal cleavage/methylation domain-containing protein [Actinomycetota bacterium]
MTKHLQRLRRRATARLDDGMTLPEVLITMVIMGTLITSLVAATSVILKQQDNSEGRLNNARSEQNVGIWLPSDLASAEDVDTSPGA